MRELSMGDDLYLNLEQIISRFVAMGFAVTERQLRRWREKDMLPFVKFGRSLYLRERHLVEYVERLQREAGGRRRPV